MGLVIAEDGESMEGSQDQGFKVGDLVFARVQGYQHWPAEIRKLPTSSGSKPLHYTVYFFGSYELGYVKATQMIPYDETSAQRYGSEKVRSKTPKPQAPAFELAVIEIAEKFGNSEKTNRGQTSATKSSTKVKESENGEASTNGAAEDTEVASKSTRKRPISKSGPEETPVAQRGSAKRRRNGDDIFVPTPPARRRGRQSVKPEETDAASDVNVAQNAESESQKEVCNSDETQNDLKESEAVPNKLSDDATGTVTPATATLNARGRSARRVSMPKKFTDGNTVFLEPVPSRSTPVPAHNGESELKPKIETEPRDGVNVNQTPTPTIGKSHERQSNVPTPRATRKRKGAGDAIVEKSELKRQAIDRKIESQIEEDGEKTTKKASTDEDLADTDAIDDKEAVAKTDTQSETTVRNASPDIAAKSVKRSIRKSESSQRLNGFPVENDGTKLADENPKALNMMESEECPLDTEETAAVSEITNGTTNNSDAIQSESVPEADVSTAGLRPVEVAEKTEENCEELGEEADAADAHSEAACEDLNGVNASSNSAETGSKSVSGIVSMDTEEEPPLVIAVDETVPASALESHDNVQAECSEEKSIRDTMHVTKANVLTSADGDADNASAPRRSRLARNIEIPLRYKDTVDPTALPGSVKAGRKSVGSKDEVATNSESIAPTVNAAKPPLTPKSAVPRRNVSVSSELADGVPDDEVDAEAHEKLRSLMHAKAVMEDVNNLIDATSLNNHDFDAAISIMHKLSQKDYIGKEMLKAFPEIVKVVQKLENFCGNSNLRMTKQQKMEMPTKAAELRSVAVSTVEIFKELMLKNEKPLAVVMMEKQREMWSKTDDEEV